MGWQLWTSPQTGYRRRGTRFSEMRSLFEEGITARAILEPLQSCPADAPSSEMAEHLDRRDFDVAGVQEGPRERATGYVRREDLTEGIVRDHCRPFESGRLVSDSIPLVGIFDVLRSHQQAFVLMGPAVRGIVTTAELNKPAARIYLFGLISLLEMHLTFWITEFYDEESWQAELSERRLVKAQRFLRMREEKNQELRLLDCLQFCDRRDIVLASSEARDVLQIGDIAEVESLLRRAEDLRNSLAHSQHDVAEGASWSEVAQVVAGVEEFLGISDAEVERRAAEAAEHFEEGLWSPGSLTRSVNSDM